jgi:hypothetical protein
MVTKRPTQDASSEDSVVLSWRYPDGSTAAGHPLPREQAERLARVYGSMYPDQTYWIETVPMDETVEYARVRRRRTQPSPRKT